MHVSRPVARWLSVASLLVPLTCGSKTALAVPEPAVFASEHGVLNLTMIAKPKPIPSISFAPPNGGAAVNPVARRYGEDPVDQPIAKN